MIHVIRVVGTEARDWRGEAVLHDIQNTLHITNVTGVKTTTVYRLEGITYGEAQAFAERVLAEDINQTFTVNQPLLREGCTIEVAYKPGVMNPEAASIVKAARDCGLRHIIAADSSIEYTFEGHPTEAEVQTILDRLLVNTIVQRVVCEEPKTLHITGEASGINIIPIRGMNDDELMALSKDKLFLNLEEMGIIRAYFQTIGRDPTDGEVEILAQTWSEHCGHKTFNARLIVNGVEKPPLMERLKAVSQRFPTLVVSSFSDNAGVIAFYDDLVICGKVETHNSPSAAEPYGGAATGSGGVFRDIIGTGKGARVVLSTDVFCLGHWNLPAKKIPPGCLDPSYLLHHVVRGVKDYGNRMGIPTAGGSLHFHPDFRAKPTVIVGAYGIMPETAAEKGVPQPGDVIIVVGGRTGRDGIHGATFSSAEMTEHTATVNATAVQIGHAIEEKRMADALLRCRDMGIIRAITDCGAGGFASAIGEMGAKTGVSIILERAPLKYPGLAPWEILLSESQERMVVAVAQEDMLEFCAIHSEHNVEATVMGVFTASERFIATYGGATLCDLDMEFLHHGLPQRVMTAHWTRPTYDEPELPPPNDWVGLYTGVMSHPNVCSREPVVRLYDHGVQGTSTMPPYGGVHHDGPNDAVVLRPIAGKPYGMVVSQGLNPILNRIDPYWGSLWAGAEALANYAAVGGNPEECAIIDNFIWPFPDEDSLGTLDMSMDALVDFIHAIQRPAVSGKDSLSSTYRGKDGTVIKIPPVLCISLFGRIPDVSKTASADIKRPDKSVLVLAGALDADAMGGSVYYDLHGFTGNRLPKVDIANLHTQCMAVHRAIIGGWVLACHDVSEGGVAVSLAEMCFGGDCGASIDVRSLGQGRADHLLFNEMAGCFLLEVDPTILTDDFLTGVHWRVIGSTTEAHSIEVANGGVPIFSVSVEALKKAWAKPMREVFP